MSDILIDGVKYVDITPIMTSNTEPSPYVAFGTNVRRGAAWELYDGSISENSYANSDKAYSMTVGLNFGKKTLVNAYSIVCNQDEGNRPYIWYIQGSNDNLSWTTLDYVNGHPGFGNGVRYDFTFDNEVGYKMYRMYIPTFTDRGCNCYINELRFYQKQVKHLLVNKINQDSLETFDANGQDHVCYTNEGDIYVTDKDGRLVEMGRKTKARIEEVNDDLNDKFNTLNIAQKTVNDVGNMSLLESPVEFNIDMPNKYGACVITNIDDDITLSDDITKYDRIYFVAKLNNTSKSTIISAQDNVTSVNSIKFNDSNTDPGDGSALSIVFNANSTLSAGALHFGLTLWFKNENTIHINTISSSIATFNKFILTDIIGVKDRSVTIDPVEYVNTESGIEDTPVGHIIQYMGTTAPKHYLSCNGSEYNITDYPFLAQHFKEQFGVYNYFGGDGTTTFAVPDHEIEYKPIIPTMSSNEQDGYVASASSETTDYEAWKAFNKTINGYPDSWLSNGGSSGWLQIELPNPLSVSAFSIASRNYKYRGDIVDFDLLGSNNGENWDTLYSITDEPAWNAGETRTYYFNNKQSYLYYRLNVTKVRMVTSTETYISIGDFDLFTAGQIDCIKYEPTYFMKNNYLGGIQKTVLFEGVADTTNTTYQLSDSVKNYPLILVAFRLHIDSNHNGTTMMIDTDDIDTADGSNAFIANIATSNTNFRYIAFNFTNGYDKLTISNVLNYGGSNVAITKITGINMPVYQA